MSRRIQRRRPRAQGPSDTDADVLVLGAGLAGLAAAAELVRCGLEVLVLEARDRCGGRIATQREPGWPLPFELGAEFVHGEAPATVALADEARVPLLDVRGTHWLRGRGGLHESRGYEERIGRAFERTGAIARKRGDRPFAQALAEARVREPTRSQVLRYVSGFQAAPPEDISTLALAGHDLGTDRIRRIPGGGDRLVERLHAQLPRASVRLGTIVETVEWSRGHARVACRTAGGSCATFKARALVLTLPLETWRASAQHEPAVRIAPAIPGLARALAKIATGHVTKLCLGFRSLFWERAGVVPARGGRSLEELGFVHAPSAASTTWWTQSPLRVPVLTGWCGGAGAQALSGLSEDELRARAIESLAIALGVERETIAGELVGMWHHDWTRDPFALGAYSYPRVGGARAALHLARPVEGTLFLAGEATCVPPDNGTVHGALASGQRAAREVRTALHVRAAARTRSTRSPHAG